MNILITGGASGLGKAIVEKMAARGSDTIFFTYHSSKESAMALEKQYPNTRSFHLDFRSKESIDSFMTLISELAPDVLINNALNGYKQTHFHKFDPAEWESSFKINIYPVLKITQKFIAISRKRKSGKIITVLTSYLLNKPPVGLSEYVANKAYLFSMSKSWAVENAAFGITSNCISPSFMQTNLTAGTDGRIIENMITEIGGKDLLKEGEVAEAIEFLVNASAHINGSNLIINDAKDLL
jgi:3-oxoacyl-[acyl-carrier protein] reductase